MSNILAYLNEIHATSSFDVIVEDFASFGVNVKNEGNLYLFKYSMIDVKWDNPLSRECRGHILRRLDGAWSWVCRTFDKFWNFHEGYCPINAVNGGWSECQNYSLRTKEDGSLANLAFYPDENRWRVSTSGSFPGAIAGDSGKSFEDLFWETIGNKDGVNNLDPSNTYMFELCTPYNMIVTQYPQSRLYLLAARNNSSGDYLHDDILKVVSGDLGVLQPEVYPFNSEWTKEDIYAEVERICAARKDCRNPEGLIVYSDQGVTICKLKTEAYLALHRISGGDPLASRNNLIEMVMSGTIDDFDMNDLLPEFRTFVDKVKEWVSDQWTSVNAFCVGLRSNGEKFVEQKEYALAVKDHRHSAFFFQNKESVLNGSVVEKDFTSYLSKSSKRFENELKGLF